MALELDRDVAVRGEVYPERHRQHVGGEVLRDRAAVHAGLGCLRQLGVVVLDERLEAHPLVEGRDLLDEAEGREQGVEHVDGDLLRLGFAEGDGIQERARERETPERTEERKGLD